MILTAADFEQAWNEELSPRVRKLITDSELAYSLLEGVERDSTLVELVDYLLQDFVVYAGEHRHQNWEEGWAQNLREYLETGDPKSILPKYFGKYRVHRFCQQLITSPDDNFEVAMVSILQTWLFEKYFEEIETIYEFGCGTGHNLMRLRELKPEATLWGLDWATSSQALLKGIATARQDNKLFGHNFNYFAPDTAFQIAPNSAVFTFASLEQTGDNFKSFVDYLVAAKPGICLNIEPVMETLDPGNLLDYLSIEYMKKRKYLKGYGEHLRQLEAEGRIEILNFQRSFVGSKFVDGYSIFAWRPL